MCLSQMRGDTVARPLYPPAPLPRPMSWGNRDKRNKTKRNKQKTKNQKPKQKQKKRKQNKKQKISNHKPFAQKPGALALFLTNVNSWGATFSNSGK